MSIPSLVFLVLFFAEQPDERLRAGIPENKRRVRPERAGPARPLKTPDVGESRVSCALRALATLTKNAAAEGFGAPKGSVSPVGCCRQRRQSDPQADRETSGGRGQRPPRRLSGQKRKRYAEGKRQPCGLLPPKAAKRPAGGPRNERRARPAPSATIERAKTEAVSRREASALWAVAAKGGKATRRRAGRKRVPSGHLPPKVAKRPEGVSKYKGCARPARRTPIFARERNERRARPAPSATIERAKTEAVRRREAQMIEQPGRPLRPTLCQRPDPRQTVYSRRHSI